MPWSPTSAPSRQRYDDIWVFDERVALAVNSSGEIRKTTDGGASWRVKFQTPLIPPDNRAVYLRCLAFADALRGWAGTVTPDHRLFRTLDGGETWAPVDNLPPQPGKICGLFAASANVVYGSGTNDPSDGAAIVKTSEGGATWQATDMSAQASSLIDIHFRDEQRGFVVGGFTTNPEPTYDNVRPVILHTQDGGKTWVDRLEGIRSEFVDGTWGWKIQFVNDSLGYVSLENFTRALILKTTDGGLTWTKIDVTGNANLEGIGFLDEAVGWVGGWGDESFSSGTSSFTDDAGQHWVNANEIGRFINRFRFSGSPPRFGYASGQSVYRFSSVPIAPTIAVAAAFAPARSLIKSPDDHVYGEINVPIEINIPPGTRQVSVQLWNRFAKEVGVLLNERDPAPGVRTLVWDRRDEKGKPARPGIYIYRVTLDDSAESQVISLK
jgi:photosystem II stability/assembly factor-like uncharacterized protein